MNQIVINYISGGTLPINVYVADEYGNNKSLIGTITNPVPPQVIFDSTIPPIFEGIKRIMLICVDANGCEIFKIIDASSQVIQVCLIFQDGREFGTQGTITSNTPEQVCAQQSATTYTVNIGYSSVATSCADTSYVINLFSAVDGWESVISLYFDPGMDSPFDGDNLWYKISESNLALQINTDGYVINKFICS